MALEVIGAGFGRTGTLSLKFALEQLGFEACYHMMEIRHHPEHTELWRQAHLGHPIDWDTLYTGYKASVDWPSCNLWETLAAVYPDAKIILSLRDPDRWYDSVMNTIYPSSSERLASEEPKEQAAGRWAMEVIWDRVFDGRMSDKQHVIDVFNRHNDHVIKTVDPDRLLVFEATNGWGPLCEFLGRPIPEEDYPRVNSTEDFRQFFPSKRSENS